MAYGIEAQKMAYEAEKLAAQEFNETACDEQAQPAYYKPSPKRYDSLFARLEKEQYQIDDIMNRRAKVEELTKLLYKHSEVGRIFDLIRELGL